MDSKEALNFINRVLLEKTNQVLNELEQDILVGSWEGLDYKTIAANTFKAETTVREVGADLWNKITQELNIKVSKKHLKNPIQHYKDSLSISLPPVIPTRETTQIKISPPQNNQNPFVPTTGRIENLEKFLGRQQEVKQIFELINNSSSVAIIGEPAIGKSSLLYAVYQQSEKLLQLPRQQVFLDMNLIHNQEDFYFAICEKLGIPDSKGYRFTRNLENKKVLLLLDNVGKLNGSGFTRDMRDHLRGLSEGENACLKLVVAANEPLRTLFNDSQNNGNTSPLEDICQQIDILTWNDNIILDFIAKRLQPTNINFIDADIQELIQESSGHPQKLTQLCYNLYKKYSESNN
ncbi:hypothetical protein H6G06_11885 [Anabaena sphaerica FACHB-251]|uniref:vWA-MoxR associated protein N-terminal HTH domain-containing protein n=1 Tax=Anabaena sphaerica FACHB-251 TaxID=2692883 RepID=A0A926ZZV3_9NOST|nr:hypothetical protein [Anabaena sphaerica]MBD2294172.1 hypothetical protein [Anabaena sphaerica FACHB-251]